MDDPVRYVSPNSVNANGMCTDASPSSFNEAHWNWSAAPPDETDESIKLKLSTARFALVLAEVTSNAALPVAGTPKTVTVTGPLVAPKGTIAVIRVDVALTTRPTV